MNVTDIDAYVDAIVAKAPPLTPEVRERITALLRTGKTVPATAAQEPEQDWPVAA
ncbi:hypothetical protein [Nocardia sp. NPDC050710]|uniref:hypothetical protein n=1 Tax=Nocardia sp. NPDC050710 TaxID=3157220 RepID=UPI0033C2C3B3